jgi:hypothetical protein
VGADLSAKGALHPLHLYRSKHRLREQVRSHSESAAPLGFEFTPIQLVLRAPKARLDAKPVGADLSAKGALHPLHLYRPKHRLREQVRSHSESAAPLGFEFTPIQLVLRAPKARLDAKPVGADLSAKGPYIHSISIVQNTVFANKFAPTVSQRRRWALSSRRSSWCCVRRRLAWMQNPWERTCPRRGPYIHSISIAQNTVFANKFAPTVSQRRRWALSSRRACWCRVRFGPRWTQNPWERTCPRRGLTSTPSLSSETPPSRTSSLPQ